MPIRGSASVPAYPAGYGVIRCRRRPCSVRSFFRSPHAQTEHRTERSTIHVRDTTGLRRLPRNHHVPPPAA
eukprot:7382746-Prymnesium_polylepis.1